MRTIFNANLQKAHTSIFRDETPEEIIPDNSFCDYTLRFSINVRTSFPISLYQYIIQYPKSPNISCKIHMVEHQILQGTHNIEVSSRILNASLSKIDTLITTSKDSLRNLTDQESISFCRKELFFENLNSDSVNTRKFNF